MEVVLIKADGPDGRDRTLLVDGGEARRVAVHAVHDLPHLVVESVFGLDDGLWAELAGGRHSEANEAATARDPKRQKAGRIVSGQAAGSATAEWLSEGHRVAKRVTNAVVNHFGDGPDSPQGVRARLMRYSSPAISDLLGRLDDDTIELAIVGVRRLYEIWRRTPPGEALRLTWPLPDSFIRDLTEEPGATGA